VTEHLAWAKGGTASFVVVADDAVTLRSSTPSPPGSRIEGTLTTSAAVTVTIKIHGSKREADGSFTLRGKLLVASRELRNLVASLVPAAAPE
jgi:hypothetical protein